MKAEQAAEKGPSAVTHLRWVPRAPGTHPKDGCGAATYGPSTPRTSPGTHRKMGDAALPFDRLTVPSQVEGHLDLFEQPGRKRVFQQPARAEHRVARERPMWEDGEPWLVS